MAIVNERWPLWQIARYINNWIAGFDASAQRTHWSPADHEALIYFSEW